MINFNIIYLMKRPRCWHANTGKYSIWVWPADHFEYKNMSLVWKLPLLILYLAITAQSLKREEKRPTMNRHLSWMATFDLQ